MTPEQPEINFFLQLVCSSKKIYSEKLAQITCYEWLPYFCVFRIFILNVIGYHFGLFFSLGYLGKL